MIRNQYGSKKNNSRSGQSIVEYVLVVALVATVIAVALVTLGESREDYTQPEEEAGVVEEAEQDENAMEETNQE